MSEELRDYFLNIDGISGESKDKTHSNELRLRNFQFCIRGRAGAGGYRTGKPVIENMTFTAVLDPSYPLIMKAMVTNQNIKKSVLTCRKAGKDQFDFFTITLTHVYVSDCSTDGSKSVPEMNFALGFRKIEIMYSSQISKGTLGGAVMAVLDLGPGSVS